MRRWMLLCVLSVGCGDDGPKRVLPMSEVACFDEAAAPYVVGAAHAIQAEALSGAEYAPAVATLEINAGCGIVRTAGAPGIPIAILEHDLLHEPDGVVAVNAIADAGARVMTGLENSVYVRQGAPTAVERGLVLGAYSAIYDDLSGCTSAELASDGVVKRGTPVKPDGSQCWDHKGLFFRLGHSLSKMGRLLVARAFDAEPELSRTAVIADDSDNADQYVAGVLSKLAEKGVTDVPVVRVPVAPTYELIVSSLKTAVANDARIVFVYGAPSAMASNVLDAYIELADGPAWEGKPASFDDLSFYSNGYFYPDTSRENDLARDLRAVSVGPGVEISSPLTARYQNVLRRQDNAAAPYVPRIAEARNYDLFLLTALAIAKVGVDAPASDIAAAIRDVANAPGEIVYADEYVKAKQLINAGIDIDYEGASGHIEFDARNDAVDLSFGRYPDDVLSNGSIAEHVLDD